MRKGNLVGMLAFIAVLSACSEYSVVGEDFIESTDYELGLNNSIPLDFTTIRFDSLITSEEDQLLIGGQTGTDFGDLEIESYFLLTLDNSHLSEFNSNLQYDSLTLTLPLNGYTRYLDEETVSETVVLEQLADELDYPEDLSVFYNYSEIIGVTDVPGIILGEKEFLWGTDRIRDLEMRISDDLGAGLFSMLEDEDEIFTDQDEANEYLRGFRLYLKDPAFAVGLVKDSVKLTLHTTDVSTSSLENKTFNFYINSQPGYSKYTHTNVPEALQSEELDDEISSDSLSDHSMIIGGLGYATKIDITGVRDLISGGDDFILASAELKLRWFEQSQDVYPQTITSALIDEDFNDIAGQTFTFNIEYDDEYGRDNYYYLDATQIVDFILSQPFGGEYYLLLTTENFNMSPTYVKLGDGSLSSEINIYTIKN